MIGIETVNRNQNQSNLNLRAFRRRLRCKLLLGRIGSEHVHSNRSVDAFSIVRIETLYGGSRLKSASVEPQVLPVDLNRVPSRSTKSQFVILIVERHVTQGIETNDAGYT
jgi:hypothetical protein